MSTSEKYIEDQHSTRKGTKNVSDHNEEVEINLIELFQDVWRQRKIVLFAVVACLILGLVVAITSPKEYTAEIILMPQNATTQNNSSSLLQQIGGFTGISIGSSSGSITPELYPDIIQSTPFYLSVMNEELLFPTKDTTMNLHTYFSVFDTPPFTQKLKQYTLGLPKLIMRLPLKLIQAFDDTPPVITPDNLISTDTITTKVDTNILENTNDEYQPIVLTGSDLSTISKVRARITTTIEPENGTIIVSTIMPDPLVAANVTELAVNYLTDYVTDYHLEKVSQDLAFIEKQFNEKQNRYSKAQQRLALLRDRNANLVTERARIELEKAQTEYNLAFSLYQSVAQQLEQAQVRVQEETPVFKVLEPIQVPLSESEPNREAIILLSIFLGVLLGIGIVSAKILYQKVRHVL